MKTKTTKIPVTKNNLTIKNKKKVSICDSYLNKICHALYIRP